MDKETEFLVKKTLTALAVMLMAVVTLSGAITPAQAASGYSYFAYAGGTKINAVGATVASDLTAQSGIIGSKIPNSASNSIATVNAADTLLNTGVVTTSMNATTVTNGVKIVGKAKTTGVSLLGGMIKVDAVDTVNTATIKDKVLNSKAATTFVGLKISGVTLPLTIPENFTVKIPGIAAVTLNGNISAQQDGILVSQGFGLRVRLLQPYGNIPLGAQVVLNPTYTAVSDEVPAGNATVGGEAYGTQIKLNVAGIIDGTIGKTASVGTPPGGTGGAVRSNSTASVLVPGVAVVGAVRSTTQAVSQPGFGEVTNTNETAGVNLLGGLITADAIKVTAHSTRNAKGFKADQSLTLVNLVIAGQSIPINVSPDTTIEIPGIAKVTINEQVKTSNANLIRGLYVKLLSPFGPLATGAEIEVAVATTKITA